MKEFIMKRVFLILTACLVLSVLLTNVAYNAPVYNRGNRGPLRDPGVRALFSHDANNIQMTISNWGEFGNPDQIPGYFGFEYPRGSETDFLFSAGLWVGAIVEDQRLVSTGSDGDNGTNEFAPSRDRFLYQSNLFFQHPLYHFSLITVDEDGDWDPENDDLDENGEPSSDWDGPDEDANGDGIFFYDPEPHVDEDPPGDISADLIDNDHDGLVDDDDDDHDGDAAPGDDDDDGDGEVDEDGAAMAAQHITAFYDDTDPHEVQSPDPDGHTPLNIRIEQRSYSWTIVDSPVNDVLIVEATIRNIGDEELNNVYFGLFADPDVAARGEAGDPASVDDWNFYDAEHLMVIHGDDTTDMDGWAPGVFAMKILHTPRPLDELNVSFKNIERVSGGDPENNRDKYDMISDDEENNSPPTNQLGDWRFLIGFGSRPDDDPWTLPPQRTFEIAFAMIGASNIEHVHQTAEAVQAFYDEGRADIFAGNYFPIPGAPSVADIGDGESILVTIPGYGQLPQVDGIMLHYGDLDEIDESIDVGVEAEHIVNELEENVSYYFAISLYDEDGEEGPVSDSTWMTPLSIPRKPIGLEIVEEGFHSINLSWQSNHELDIAGYNLYRSINEGEFQPINEDPIHETEYSDEMDQFMICSYRLSAVDEDGNESAVYGVDSLDVPVVGAPFTIEDGSILLVDETRNGNGRPGSPNDEQCDDFYHELLQIYQYDELDYDQFRADHNRVLRAIEIGRYEIIIWHGDDKSQLYLGDNIGILSNFLEFGGKMIISGWDIFRNFAYEDWVISGEDSFVRRRLGITSARCSQENEFVGAVGQHDYHFLELDRNKIPGRWDGLDEIWEIEPHDGELIYTFVSHDVESDFHGVPCGIRRFNRRGAVVVLGFPLYFMEIEGASSFMRDAIEDMRVDIEDDNEVLSPAEFRLDVNYPNPFNATTIISFTLPVSCDIRLMLYDLHGREIMTLKDGSYSAGTYHVNANLASVPSGIYLYSLHFSGQVIMRKMVLMK